MRDAARIEIFLSRGIGSGARGAKLESSYTWLPHGDVRRVEEKARWHGVRKSSYRGSSHTSDMGLSVWWCNCILLPQLANRRILVHVIVSFLSSTLMCAWSPRLV